MVVFKSLVVVDLESSGLPTYGKTKITEVSFIGVLVNHILDCNRVGKGTPRVLQKLNVCFYPQKGIDFEATEITGLDNWLLEDIPILNKDACGLLQAFLRRMPSPICLVAHNGMQFDFQLLKAELASKNENFPEDLLCADSLIAFRELFPIAYVSPTPLCNSFSSLSLPGIVPLNAQCQLHSSDASPEQPPNSRKELEYEVPDTQSVCDMEKANNTTPKARQKPDCPPSLKRKSDDEHVGIRNGYIRKKLFRGQEKLRSHKLGDLYQHLLGKEQDGSHRAENDTMALLECIVTTAPKFLSWIERNNLNFSKIPCMW